MERIVKFKDFVTEALGVPTGIIPLAKQLFDYLIDNIENQDDLEDLVKFPILMEGNFSINDMKIKKIILGFNFNVYNSGKGKIDFLGMGSHFQSYSGVSKKFRIPYVKTNGTDEILITIDLAVSQEIIGQNIIDYLLTQKNYFIPIFAHELKHFYDKFKKPRQPLAVWTEYSTISKNNFGGVKPLNDYLFLSYYLHEFENLVRPTEFAAMLDIHKITPDKFKEYFVNTEIYQFLKQGQNFSLSNLKNDLKNYLIQMVSILCDLGYNPVQIIKLGSDSIVELILKEFYENLLTWKGDTLQKFLFPLGKHPMRFIGKKDEYFDDYLNKILKFGSDYKKFYENEEKFLKSESTKMIKKLSGLYALTDIYKKK